MNNTLQKASLYFLAFTSFFLFTGHALFAQGISISPSRVFFTGSPGETIQQTLTFTNTSDKAYNFNTRIEDWTRDSIGDKVFSPKGTLEKSNANWIALPGQVVSIGPKETKEILVEMKVPNAASTSKMTNSMLFFTQLVPQDDNFVPDEANMGIRVLFEFGIHAYYTPPGNSKLDIKFTALEDRGLVKNGERDMRKIGIKVKNIGNVNNDAKINLELTNTSTGEEIKVEPVQISLMPDDEQWAFFYIAPEIKGNYLAVSLINLGTTTDTRVAEKEFSF